MFAPLLLAAVLPASAATAPVVERSTAPILVVFPTEKMQVPQTDGEFVLGSIADPSGTLTINGSTVSVYRTGAFLAWIPVQSGTFTFHCALTLRSGATFTLDRAVQVAAAQTPLPAKPNAIDRDSIQPKADMELRPGDWLVARAKASPGLKGQFRLGRRPWQPMREYNPGLGLYEGVYLIPAGEDADPAPVEFKIGSASEKSAAKVSVRASAPLVASVRGTTFVNVKTGPSEGQFFPALGGTRFLTAGHEGAETKLALGGDSFGWLDTKSLEFMPAGAAPPRAVTDSVTLRPAEDATIVRIGLTERVPFTVEEADDLRSLTVRVRYAYAHTNWIVYNSGDDFVDEVRLAQEASDVVAFKILLKPGRVLWGYQTSFDGSGLRVELRKPPRLGPKVLQGRVIFLDPGHMPSAPGAIGGLGTKEMDVNYRIAEAVEKLLLKEGAKPILSRATAEDEVGLVDRPRMALEKRAELFVSIHNNNLPGEHNPFHGGPHGYSVFYFHPHSFALARAIYEAYGGRVPLTGEELRYGDLLVARLSGMPAVLTESAYMTYPEQEELLLQPEFRAKIARAIVEGIRSFLEQERKRQAAAGKPKAGRS